MRRMIQQISFMKYITAQNDFNSIETSEKGKTKKKKFPTLIQSAATVEDRERRKSSDQNESLDVR